MLDPDVRFLLANERTLLAWVRTALALIGGGLALTQLGNGASRPGFGLGAIAMGAAMAMVGYARYRAADRAIRSGRLPKNGRGPAIQVAGVVALAMVLVAVILVRPR
jgi:putative membrane protein